MSEAAKLRLITYMVPGLPLGLYQTYQHYLEEALETESSLQVESRWSGPPSDRSNPFTNDEVDIGFLSSTSYLYHAPKPESQMDLLPVAPIHIHPQSELRPIYFSDVIIPTEDKEKYKNFHDLKGCIWAYTADESLSGNIATLAELRKEGVNSSFFGHVLRSGSHHNSIKLVLDGRANAAGVDSSVFQQFILDHPEYKNKLTTLCSWGPLPIQPIVVNKRMPEEARERILTALLKMNENSAWQTRLNEQHVWGFKSIDSSLYNMEENIRSLVKNRTMNAIYY